MGRTRDYFQHSPLVRGTLIFLLLNLLGTFGYMIIDQYSFMDGLFMTFISVTTVGYGEVKPLSDAGEVYTMILMFVSILSVGYIIGYMTTYIVSGVMYKNTVERIISKNMEHLKDHTIVCGYGVNGQSVAKTLSNRNQLVVIIDRTVQPIKLESGDHIFTIHDVAPFKENLIKAGVKTARQLLATRDSDEDNMYIVMLARALNPGLYILTRTFDPIYRERLLRAGADDVLLPADVTAHKMSELMMSHQLSNYVHGYLTNMGVKGYLKVLDIQGMDTSWRDKTLDDILQQNMTVLGGLDTNNDYQYELSGKVKLKNFKNLLVNASDNVFSTVLQMIQQPVK